MQGVDMLAREAGVLDWALALTAATWPVHLLILVLGLAVIASRPAGKRAGCATVFIGLPLFVFALLFANDYGDDIRGTLTRRFTLHKKHAARREAYLAAKQAEAPHRAGDEARLAELCRQTGRFIHRQAKDVEGVFLMKLRPTLLEETKGLWAKDPYGNWHDGESSALNGFAAGYYIGAFAFKYPYVDAIDPEDGKRYRYTGVYYHIREQNGKRTSIQYTTIERREVTPDMPLPRYGVTWDDITEREDRERFWIAGSSLKVIDLKSGEVMGERIGYMMSNWQRGQEAPFWEKGHVRWCPDVLVGMGPGENPGNFVREVLIPKHFEIPTRDHE